MPLLCCTSCGESSRAPDQLGDDEFKCPACDDFIQDSRVLEIESRQLENRERALGVERVRLENRAFENDPISRRIIQLEGLPEGATVHLHVRDVDESTKTSIGTKPSGNP